MSNLSGGGGAGFKPSVNASAYTTQIQARQAELQKTKETAVGNYGTPMKADSFAKTVQEQVVSGAIPQNHPFKSPLAQALYPKKAPSKEANPFAQSDTNGLMADKNIDWTARQKFAEDSDSLASLS